MVGCFSFQANYGRSLCIAYLGIHLASIRTAWEFQKREDSVILQKKKKDLDPFRSFKSCADSIAWLKYTVKQAKNLENKNQDIFNLNKYVE